MLRTFTKAIAVFVLSAVLVPLSVAGTVMAVLLFLPMPAVLPEPKALIESRPSEILDINGNPIGLFRKFETNIPFTKEDVPVILKQAVISAEDRNFYEHSGVDLRGTLRAFREDLRRDADDPIQGGSTITQQYVKKAYVGEERTITRKIREAILASQLDRQVDKEEILYRYLSTIYLGNGAYGVQAASNLYFRKNVRDLNASEAAMLAGLIPAPSRYEPLGNPNLAEEKRRLVLQKMLEQGYLTPEEHAQWRGQGLWYANSGAPATPATLIHQPLQVRNQFPYFIDYVERALSEKYGERLYTGGFRIQTTLDPKLQALAEETVAKTLQGTRPELELALVAVEPPTGYVKALVGGRDFYGGSQVNLALGGCPRRPADKPIEVEATCWTKRTPRGGGSGRQPGSAFKPFTLATALGQGVSPAKVYSAPRSYLPKACRGRVTSSCKPIGNYGGAAYGAMPLRNATWRSVNTVYAQLIEDVGVKETAEMAKRLGITSAWFSPAVHGLSYTLGAIEVSPLDMASAYGVFATGGKRAEPTPVLKVVDAAGRVLEDRTKPESEQVIDQAIADNVTDILRGVIESGTGTRGKLGRPAAGKTGSTNDNTNAYFAGFTPTLSTAVWMGYPKDNVTPMHNVKGFARVDGGTLPTITWHNFMSRALDDVPVTDFNEPAPIRPVRDRLKRQARAGFDPGPRRAPLGTPVDCGGPCAEPAPMPVAVAPATTTTTTPDDDDEDDDPILGAAPP